MARLPDVTDFGARPTARPQGGVQNYRGGIAEGAEVDAAAATGGFGETLFKGGAALAASEEKQEKNADRLAMAKARSDFRTAQIRLSADFAQDNDWRTMRERYTKQLSETHTKISENLAPHLRGIFNVYTQDDAEKAIAAVRTDAWGKEVSEGKSTLDLIAEQSIAGATGAADEDSRATAISTFRQALDGAVQRGYIDDAAAEKRRHDFTQRYVTSRMTDWFRRETDPVSAAQQLYDGKLADRTLQGLYDRLPPDERTKLFGALVQDANRMATLKSQQRDAADKAAKDSADAQVKAFYLEDMGFEQRMALYNRLRTNPHVSATVAKDMEQFIAGGGRASIDNQADLFRTEAAIRDGEIKNELDLINFRNEHGLQVSIETMRARLTPMIENRRDERFRNVLDWGQAELGIAGGGILGDVFKDNVDKAAQYEAEMRRYRQDNPTGDFWKHAETVVSRLKTQGNASLESMLPQQAQRYRDALAGGNAEEIAKAKSALIFTMTNGRMVTGAEAARADFDPLSVIDKDR